MPSHRTAHDHHKAIGLSLDASLMADPDGDNATFALSAHARVPRRRPAR